jgi:hypothetical protein
MFTAMRKDRCLYCGSDLKNPEDESIGGQILSSLRELWARVPRTKARQKLQSGLRAR